jgi:hypothetical protein
MLMRPPSRFARAPPAATLLHLLAPHTGDLPSGAIVRLSHRELMHGRDAQMMPLIAALSCVLCCPRQTS